MVNNTIALLWGFAESTFFFIVPDVWFTIVGRDNLRAGLLACFYGLAGALAGGLLIYLWGRSDLATASAFIEAIPAIGPVMVQRVHAELEHSGATAILLGPLKGTPYKVYAFYAAEHGIGIGEFLLISIPARLIRFLTVTVVFHIMLRIVNRLPLNVDPLHILLTVWTLFYALYFYRMPN